MSMREYAVDSYGILLDKPLMKTLAGKICDEYSDDEYEEDPYGFNEAVEESLGCIDYIGNFSGEAFPLENDGREKPLDSEEYSDEAVYILTANRTPSLFKAAYKDMDEMVEDFKYEIGIYLDPDFDYRSRIRQFVGTYWG